MATNFLISCPFHPMKKDLISILDVKDEIEEIIDLAIKIKEDSSEPRLKGKWLAMIFEKPSARTRVSFDVGISKLGGHSIFLGMKEIQLGKRESIQDVALVLSRYVDIIMYRAFKNENVRELARNATVPVINGLDDKEHPCQVMADLMTIKEKKGELNKLNLAFIGDGNSNMAHSYLLGCAITGMNIKIISPKKYRPSSYYIKKAEEIARKGDSKIEIIEDVNAVTNADIVATDAWVAMGQESEREQRVKDFDGYTVNEKIMSQAKPDAIFMHCMPIHYGKEVTKNIAHGKQSVIFDEAENRLWAQMAIMVKLLG